MTESTATRTEQQRRRDYSEREAELWAAFMESRGMAERNALIEHYTGWIHVVARDVFQRLHVPGTEWADYVHYATIGLMECIDRFDPSFGVYFQTYARHRLRGAILNNIGSFAERTGHEFDSALRFAERTQSLNESSEDDGLQEIIDVSVGLAIGYLLELGTLPSGTPLESSTYHQAETESLIEALKESVTELPEKERFVISGHYFRQMTFVEIAEVMQLTKGRISQLHRQAVQRLRDIFEQSDSMSI